MLGTKSSSDPPVLGVIHLRVFATIHVKELEAVGQVATLPQRRTLLALLVGSRNLESRRLDVWIGLGAFVCAVRDLCSAVLTAELLVTIAGTVNEKMVLTPGSSCTSSQTVRS